MDTDHRELVRHLFAAATALVETAHEATIEGQADCLQDDLYQAAAHRLLDASDDLHILAKAIAILIPPDAPAEGMS
jgi:hypothetical protein